MIRLLAVILALGLLGPATPALAEEYRFASGCEAADLIPAQNADRMLVVCNDRSSRLIEIPSGQPIRILSPHDLPAGLGKVDAIAVSPDGAAFAESFYDGTLVVVAANKDDPIRTLKTDTYVNNLRFAPDGRVLFADHRRIEVGPKLEISGMVHTAFDTLNDVAFSNDHRSLAAVAADTGLTVLSLPSLTTLKTYRGLQVEPMTAAYSSDGTALVVGLANGDLLVFDPRSLVVKARATSPSQTSIAALMPASARTMLVKFRPWVGGDSAYGVLDIPTATFKPIEWDKVTAAVARNGRIWLFCAKAGQVIASTWPAGR